MTTNNKHCNTSIHHHPVHSTEPIISLNLTDFWLFRLISVVICRGGGVTAWSSLRLQMIMWMVLLSTNWMKKSKTFWWHWGKKVNYSYIQEEGGVGRNICRKWLGHKTNSLEKLPERNDTGGNKLTRQVNKRLMHSNTIKIVLILLQTKHATNALYPISIWRRESVNIFSPENMKTFWIRDG